MTNIEQLKRLAEPIDRAEALTAREQVAYTMRHMGASYTEIGKVYDASRQYGEGLVKSANAKLKGGE